MISNIFLPPDDLSIRTRWYAYLRWFILLVILVPGLTSLYIGSGWSEQLRYQLILGVIALSTNGIFFILSRLLKNDTAIRVLVSSVFICDIALITYFIYSNGGIESRSIVMYAIPVIMSAAIFGRLGVYVFVGLSLAAYDALLLCNYFSVFQSPNAFYNHLQTDFPYVLNTIVLFNAVLILVGLTVDFIARLLISKENLANKRLDELVRAQSIAMFGSWEWKVGEDIVSWSDELYRIFGVEKTPEPISFERYLSFIHPDDRTLVAGEIKKAIKGRKSFSFSHRIVLPDSTVRYVQSNGQSYSDKKGTVTHMIGAAHDITEPKLLESAKNDFVAVTSHQLRTPATIVKQYATLLQEGYAGDMTEAQKAYLKTIYDSNERQITIINDLLNVARIDSGHFNMDIQRTDIVAMLKQIKAEHVGKYQAKNQKLIFRPQYKNLYCEIDAEQIRMAVENLLDNAHKYTPAKKTIRIELKRRRACVEVAISDQGIGIPAKDIHKIFDMFSRIENPSGLQEEGTGIGLYWAKKIVTMHGGSITVSSTRNTGSTFTVTLPRVQ
ncbi:MAG TPA: ATP-binding protein [Candidatus Saccharimonadales bacterium]|nr:ATP-binding protein [Candidatus Saccharimonadales bacterium]